MQKLCLEKKLEGCRNVPRRRKKWKLKVAGLLHPQNSKKGNIRILPFKSDSRLLPDFFCKYESTENYWYFCSCFHTYMKSTLLAWIQIWIPTKKLSVSKAIIVSIYFYPKKETIYFPKIKLPQVGSKCWLNTKRKRLFYQLCLADLIKYFLFFFRMTTWKYTKEIRFEFKKAIVCPLY